MITLLTEPIFAADGYALIFLLGGGLLLGTIVFVGLSTFFRP
jgi:hypothetical protein